MVSSNAAGLNLSSARRADLPRRVDLNWRRILPILLLPAFVKLVNAAPHGWRYPVDELPSEGYFSTRDDAFGGIIFVLKLLSSSATGVIFMNSYREKNASVVAETYMPPFSAEDRRNLKITMGDVKPYIEQEKKDIGIEETARPSNRRRRLGIYIPSLTLK
jgi:hypothetical protein